MSLRRMPDRDSTSTVLPLVLFEPSAGYGPPVSLAISLLGQVLLLVDPPLLPLSEEELPSEDVPLSPPPHPIKATGIDSARPPADSQPRACRRPV
jgi:hypothetical protein